MALSYLSMMNAPRSAVTEMQRQLMDRQREATTGRKADVGLSLGGRTHQAVALRYDFDLNASLLDINGLAKADLDVTQGALASLSDLAHSFTATLVGARNAVNGQQLIKQAAEQAMASFTSLMNTANDGRQLFAGINGAVRPLADYLSTPASAGKQAIDAAFLAEFGFAQSSPSATGITSAQMEAFVDGALANEFSAANWSANWSSASNQNRPIRLDQAELVDTAINANLQPFRELAMALTMVQDAGTGNLSTGTFQKLVDKAAALSGKASGGLSEVQAAVGAVQGAVSAAHDRLERRNTILSREINSLEGVDPYAAATNVNTLTNQLEASYALTARLSRLSLLDFIS